MWKNISKPLKLAGDLYKWIDCSILSILPDSYLMATFRKKQQFDPTSSLKEDLNFFSKQALSSGCANQCEYKHLTTDFPIKPGI